MPWPEWSLDRILAERPAIRINQLGYLPDRPMVATLVSPSTEPMAFAVRDRTGLIRRTGHSAPWRPSPEPTSGLSVHRLDFSGLSATGSGFRLEAGDATSHSFAIGDDLYAGLAADALRFFTLMRSGMPTRDDTLPGYARPAGHAGLAPNTGDTSVPAWTGPDAEALYPGFRCAGTFDVSGGWYDAGDFGKYVTSGAMALWQLLSTLELDAPEVPEWRSALVDECRWQLDWMMRMQVPADQPLAGMAFHRVHGTEWSPLPGRPHEDPTVRVLHRPSTGATLQLAAVTAQAARLLGDLDQDYAQRLLDVAQRAYAAALQHPTLIAPDDHARFGGGPYGDDQLADDWYWAAAELWLVTGEQQFERAVLDSPEHTDDAFDLTGFDYDRVAAPARIDLALHGHALPDHDRVSDSVPQAADRLIRLQEEQPWGQPYAPTDGWDWGSNGRILNNLVVLAAAHQLSGLPRYADAVGSGLDYLFGRNALGQSYVTGYGTDHSRHQRTRQFGHDLDPALPPPPPGALAGGANSRPAPDFPYDPRMLGLPPQCCYLDEPTSEVTNDVCIRWNAPLVWLSAYLTYGWLPPPSPPR